MVILHKIWCNHNSGSLEIHCYKLGRSVVTFCSNLVPPFIPKYTHCKILHDAGTYPPNYKPSHLRGPQLQFTNMSTSITHLQRLSFPAHTSVGWHTCEQQCHGPTYWVSYMSPQKACPGGLEDLGLLLYVFMATIFMWVIHNIWNLYCHYCSTCIMCKYI